MITVSMSILTGFFLPLWTAAQRRLGKSIRQSGAL